MATCQRVGCTDEATGQLVIVLPAPPPHTVAARGQLEVVLCGRHQKEATLEQFLNDKARQEISAAFVKAGFAVPDFSKARIDFDLFQ